MAYKPWITAGFVTVCCFMSMVSKNFVQPFLRSRKLLRYTLAWTKLHKWSWAESLALMMSFFMALTWSGELNYCVWFDGTVCEQPALVCRCPQSFSVHWTWICFSTCPICSFNLNFRYMATSKQAASKQADIHTHVRNAVTLVWGSLRLAPISASVDLNLARI